MRGTAVSLASRQAHIAAVPPSMKGTSTIRPYPPTDDVALVVIPFDYKIVRTFCLHTEMTAGAPKVLIRHGARGAVRHGVMGTVIREVRTDSCLVAWEEFDIVWIGRVYTDIACVSTTTESAHHHKCHQVRQDRMPVSTPPGAAPHLLIVIVDL